MNLIIIKQYLYCLISGKNLLYLKNMPDYSIRVFQLNYFIKLYFPELFNVLNINLMNINNYKEKSSKKICKKSTFK